MAIDAFAVGLEPFGISPNPRFIYFDSELLRAHQALLDGLCSGIGVAAVTGERGVGKTTLLHYLAAELDVADHLVVYVSCLGSPSLGDIMGAFGFRIGFPGQPKRNRGVKSQTSFAEMLGFLGVCGTKAILFLDDADSLRAETLSGLLSMSDEGSEDSATVSIVLAGSLDLARRLERLSNPSSDKKLDLIVPLSPLTPEDVESYISHRLQMAGHMGASVFEPEAIARIAHYAHGNPQAINCICRATMVIAADQSQETVTKRMVEQVTWSARGTPMKDLAGAEDERRCADARAGSNVGQEEIGAADGPREGVSARFGSADPATAPATSEESLSGNPYDGDCDGAHGGTKPAFEAVMPPGRELNGRLPVEMHDIPRGRTRARGRRRLVTVGALSAIAAAALYLVVGGEATDGASISTDVAASINAEQDRENPSQSTFVATSASELGEPSQRGNGPSQPPEWQEAIPREAFGSALEQAVYLGDVRAVDALLDAGADINAPISGGRTLLMVAADSGDKAMVMSLIDRGADLSLGTVDVTAVPADRRLSDLETSAGSASSAAVETQHSGSGEGLDANSRGNLGRALLASTAGDGRGPLSLLPPPRTSVSVMPQSPAGPGQRDSTVAEAAHEGVEDGTNEAGSTDLGVTPLIAAARAGHPDVVDVLLAAGADANAADARGRTPLIAAVDSGDRVSAGLLMARDADLHAVDDTGRSALDIAREKGRWDLVDLISVRAKHPPMETAALQLSAARQAPADAGNSDAAENAVVTRQRPGPSRVQRQSAPGGVKNRARVLHTQRFLRQLGYDPGPVDGIRGAKTRSAVRRFQRDQGLKVDGRITADLLISLAGEAGARGGRQLTRKAEPGPRAESFFHAMLSELQELRGLEFDSKKDPVQISRYCGKNLDNWIYDKGTQETVYCEYYVRGKSL